MTKKFNRFIILTIMLLFVLSVPVFAREVDVKEIGNQIDLLQQKLNVTIDSYYIIGNYVFTSNYKLNTRDIMLAARSIQISEEYNGKNKDNVLSEMTIHKVERTFDNKFQPTGWKIKENYVGETSLTNSTKLDIHYIDYNYVKDLFTVEFDLDGGEFADKKTSIMVEEGEKIKKDLITGKNAPTREGKKFKEWVKVENGQDGAVWDFDTDVVNSNITLKATWYNEVNTENLLKEAQSKIQKNEFYGATFENKVLTYQIYDKNKKNSEIKDTGLVATIRDILKNDNVKLLTVTYGNNHYDFNSAEMNDAESEAYKKLKELLAAVANKEFDSIIQGDLVGKELTLTIQLNENIACSQNNNSQEEYTIKFTYEEPATVGEEIPQKDKNELQSTFNYTQESIYQIEGEDGSYKVTGSVKEQKNITGFGENPTGFYFAYTITLNEGIDLSSVKVKIPKGDNEDAGYNIATKDDFTENQLTVLMEVGENENVKYRDIIVEVDGVPTKIRIDFSELKFLHAHTVSFKGIKANALTVWDGEKITEDMLPKDIAPTDAYHEFAYWNKEDGTQFSEITVTKDSGDIAVVAHWNLYSDKFVADVLEDLNSTENTSKSENFSEEFIIENYVKNSGEVTIAVLDPTTKLSRMNDTSIPGAIAYILLKDEIQEITLSVNGKTETFTKGNVNDLETLKENIKNGAKKLYSEILETQFEGKNDDTVTLSDLANKENYNSFTLKFNPEKVTNTVTLVKSPMENEVLPTNTVEVPTDYTFTFEANVAKINSEQTLKNAIAGAVKTIYIDGDFNVNEPIKINRDVVISTETNKHTISANSDIDSIFSVTNNANVTINNIKLKGTKKDIVVESGSLTTAGLEIIKDGDTLPEGFEAAIEVKSGATLTAKELIFEGETYEKPAVKAGKSATVNFTDSASKPATKLDTIEKITKYEKQEVPKNNLGDKKEVDSTYNYNNYYNKEENSKIYKIVFHNHEGRRIAEFVRYCYHDDIIEEPSTADSFIAFGGFDYDGYTYDKIGYTENGYKTVFFNDNKDGVIENLGKASSDKYYFIAYKATLKNSVKHVTDADSLEAALSDPKINEIYIENNIDYTKKGPITINKELSIIGPPRHITLQVDGGIKVTADDVFIHRIDFEINATSDDKALIDVTTKSSEKTFKFILWQSSLKNVGTPVDSAIKLEGSEKVATDIRWNTFESGNIKNTFIDIEDALAGVSEICGNTFKKISSSDKKISDITIKSFDASAQKTDTDEPIRIENNTYNNDYAIKILKEANEKVADILLSTTKQIVIAVECTTSEDFSKIKFYTKDVHNIINKYLNISGEEIDKPAGVQDIKVVGMESAE